MALTLLDLSEAKKARAMERRTRPTRRRSAYAGSSTGRLTQDFQSIILSPDQEIRYELRRLRARSREVCRNNPYGVHFLEMLDKNVIGPNGITMVGAYKGEDDLDELSENVNDELERGWEDWGKVKTCAVTGMSSWCDLQDLIVKTVAQDGEVFLRHVRGFDNQYGYSVQLIDADLMDHEYNLRFDNGNEITMGVEKDVWKRPVAYWMWTSHPADYLPKKRVRIPADQIEHIFVPTRINQTRGIPWLYAAMINLYMLGAYEEAEIIAARIGASKQGFFTSESGDVFQGDPNEDGTLPDEVSPGSFQQLPAGVDFKAFTPEHPTTAFEPFIKACLRGVAAGLNVSYHGLSGDLRDVNYSSIRQGMLDERDFYRKVQRFYVEHLCEPVYGQWINMALLAGALKLPLQDDYSNILWRPRGWEWVDPFKDTQAAIERIRSGLSTWSEEVSKLGISFDELCERRTKDLKIMKDLGIEIDLGAKVAPNQQEPVQNDNPAPNNA